MATGQVSSITGDTWQLISTTTMAGAASYTVSSLTGYKTLMVAIAGNTKSAADALVVKFNGDTAIGNYARAGGIYAHFYLDNSTTTTHAAAFTIYDTNQSAPHRLEITGQTGTQDSAGMYLDPTPITSFTITTDGTATLNAGTIKVYGIAA
jgi:hypothetical protein